MSTYLDTLHSFYGAEQRYVAAGGAAANADFSEMGAHFHPNVVVRQGPTVPFAGDWFGIDAIERFFALFTETWSSLELTEIRYFEGETGVAVAMRMQATARSTGKLLDTRVGHFFIFEDGLIREINVFYLDPVEVMGVTLASETGLPASHRTGPAPPATPVPRATRDGPRRARWP